MHLTADGAQPARRSYGVAQRSRAKSGPPPRSAQREVGLASSRSFSHNADVAQLARASPCQGEGRGFEPRHPLHSREGQTFGRRQGYGRQAGFSLMYSLSPCMVELPGRPFDKLRINSPAFSSFFYLCTQQYGINTAHSFVFHEIAGLVQW
ncbi:MAG: hypothetical protein UY85_C0001G0007 [Candidatus Peribacteria bacterium GW2011_GWB1_54_5]|nr:MAG: hypothetical protein UY85_C0001G0007 [Candidatus Peribacteria bacterium GW2011_GWB1_54_5]